MGHFTGIFTGISPEVWESFTGILREFCGSFMEIQWEFDRNFTGILREFYGNLMELSHKIPVKTS